MSNNKKETQQISILTWNIHDIMDSAEGSKNEDRNFCNILTKSNIFCLQETKGSFSLPDYRCFNSLRKDSRSGGICIGIHRSLQDKIREVKINSPDIQAVTLRLDIGLESKNISIINVYDSPDNGSYKKRKKQDNANNLSTLDDLLDVIANNKDLGEIYLTGDFNARTSNNNHEYEDEIDESAPNTAPNRNISYPTIPNRVSKDNVVNKRGKDFLDFLACTNLSLLNGCTIGDVLGDYTCTNYNGTSVVDYTATSRDLKPLVNSFRVLDLTEFSDHKPIVCKVNIQGNFMSSKELLKGLEDAPNKYKWNSESDTTHKRFLAQQLEQHIAERISQLTCMPCNSKDDVYKLNSEIVSLYHDLANEVLPTRKCSRSHDKNSSYRRTKAKNPWFDSDCIIAKCKLRRLAKAYGASPTNEELRICYYLHKKEYRILVKNKKENFILNLTLEIEEGHSLNWSKFQKLKGTSRQGARLDAFDFMAFCTFFKKLYSNKSLPTARINELQSTRSNIDISKDLTDMLNKEISFDEITDCIKKCKKGKAVAEDLILNEFLKASNKDMLLLIQYLFNKCLELGAYPWSTSLVTPLHKKGDIYDPNNYRAIAVASNLGKLFSSILLQRLLSFRKEACPDTPNQLGFCKNAQTADHILVLNTVINKYVKKQKGRLYSCFVDYAKAFDSVCREALLYKLWTMGIQGRFFNCLEEMYSGSNAKLKLLNKLSENIDLLCGTEQGHPMSPELFKCFIHQLSVDLNELQGIKVPQLNTVEVTHLLWADDLVLLALDHNSLQAMLEILFTYCNEWGLTVNTSKTAVMVFNRGGRLLNESNSFKFGDTVIPSAREYCYLGVTFSLNGSLKVAQDKLRQKGLRSYFALKKLIDPRGLRKSVLFRLFDALICPVASYGCQVWLPTTHAFNEILTSLNSSASLDKIHHALPKVASDSLERLHLSFLKWTLGVNKYASNAAVWGDTGRYPLVITLAKQVFTYKQRLERMDSNNSQALVRHAFREQEISQLDWLTQLKDLKACIEGVYSRICHFPSQIRRGLREWFRDTWNRERLQNKKLVFYNSIKETFELELYLKLDLGYWESKRTAQFRTSSHSYNIESGRYGLKRDSIVNRACPSCCDTADDTLSLLSELPFFNPIIEDELHILTSCPMYSYLREKLKDPTISALHSNPKSLFSSAPLIRDISDYLKKVHDRRFPKSCPHLKNRHTQTLNP